MADTLTNIRKQVQAFDFETLFIEDLGWDTNRANHSVTAYNQTYNLKAIAQKRGMVALLCPTIPEYKVRVKIEKEVAKAFRENLIVYANTEKTQQIWQWVRREIHQPIRNRQLIYDKGQSGQIIAQTLVALVVELDEEENLTIVDVTSRVRAAFDVERVTRRFYDQFEHEHDAFLTFINGIPDKDLHRWYASIMLNRIMFIYFVQKKGFLAGDINYLSNKFEQTEGNFYRTFLLPLFFDGFATKKRSAAIQKLLGDIPYLNGGLFLTHQIEERYGEKIHIENVAFEKLFSFLDEWKWNLDERPLKNDNEINPDVLGYIFEKYINQKQMGAYYTKEDITEYISKNAVIPYLFEAAYQEDKIAFEGEHSVWDLLQESPNRYIYPALSHGVELPLPFSIEGGIHDVSKRDEWNIPAPDDFALPTEIWRDVVSRRQRYMDVYQNLVGGKIRSINDLITHNLDIQQFAQDVIENSDSADLLRAFWKAITTVSVLDPTCGSGAFLFAALNILEPLYEACLMRMEGFISDFDRNKTVRSQKYADFRTVLERIDQHPNRRYFVLKSIIVNNLFGVDIMDEAVEICKLRLFLKLVSQVEKRENIEPLPDIDFNIRSGNTLVGFATQDEVRKAISTTSTGQGKLMFSEDVERLNTIEEKARDIDRLFRRFREQQTVFGGEVTAQDKVDLRNGLKEIEHELNLLLAAQYGVNNDNERAYAGWLQSHRPFHWFIEFYGTLKEGGFDVIIGNPPYVESKDVTNYKVKNFETEPSGDLYAYTTERALKIARSKGRIGLIIPISIFGTDGFKTLQQYTLRTTSTIWVSYFANRPSQLFEGAQKRLTILLGIVGYSDKRSIFTTGYLRWKKNERETLFPVRINYVTPSHNFTVFPAALEKRGSQLEITAFSKLVAKEGNIGQAITASSNKVYYTRKFGYFLAFLNFIPAVIEIKSGKSRLPSELKEISFKSETKALAIIAALTSSTFFWFWSTLSDCRNLNKRDLLAFPLNPDSLSNATLKELSDLGSKYLQYLRTTSQYMVKSGLRLESFRYAECKPIIDDIDRVLKREYGFTDEELDFIINYDIKYRVGIKTTVEDVDIEENGSDE